MTVLDDQHVITLLAGVLAGAVQEGGTPISADVVQRTAEVEWDGVVYLVHVSEKRTEILAPT